MHAASLARGISRGISHGNEQRWCDYCHPDVWHRSVPICIQTRINQAFNCRCLFLYYRVAFIYHLGHLSSDLEPLCSYHKCTERNKTSKL